MTKIELIEIIDITNCLLNKKPSNMFGELYKMGYRTALYDIQRCAIEKFELGEVKE